MVRHCLRADRSLFLIIDLQENLMKVMDHAGKVYNNTRLFLAACRVMGIPVVVTEQYPKGLGRTVPEVAEHLGGHTLIEKITFSACTEDALKVLAGFNRKQVLVAGSETHVCVFQTVRDLVAAGYEVYILRDAVCSRFKDNYRNGIELMKEEGAVITDTETAIFDLLKVAGTTEFKAVSTLLKQRLP